MRETREYIACTGRVASHQLSALSSRPRRIIGVRFVLANETETRLASKSFNFDGIYPRRYFTAPPPPLPPPPLIHLASYRSARSLDPPGRGNQTTPPSVWNK